MIRDGLPVWFFWEDSSDELLPRKMSLEEAFEVRPPPPIGLVHVAPVTFHQEGGIGVANQALCGFERAANRRFQAARMHPFGPDLECSDCRAAVEREWGSEARPPAPRP